MSNSDTPDLIARLAERLAQATPGETVTHSQLSNAIGQDVKMCRYLLYGNTGAFAVVGKELGIQFITEWKVGYRRLRSDEIVKVGQTARKKIRGTSKKAIRGMADAIRTANDITDEQKRQVYREQSTLGLINALSREKHMPVVPPTENRSLTPGQTARDFLQRIGNLPPDPKPPGPTPPNPAPDQPTPDNPA